MIFYNMKQTGWLLVFLLIVVLYVGQNRREHNSIIGGGMETSYTLLAIPERREVMRYVV